MSLQLPRFRLRTILIAMVVIGLVLSRFRVGINESGTALEIYGSHRTLLRFYRPSRQMRTWAGEPWWYISADYFDRYENDHDISALFSFETCPCCGQSWEWDGERYVE